MRQRKRNVRKSHPGVAGRKKKMRRDRPATSVEREHDEERRDEPLFLRELFEESDDSDTADGDGQSAEDEEADTAGTPSQAELYRAVGPYNPPPGYLVRCCPTPEEWAQPSKVMVAHMRIAHKFDDKWYEGTFKGEAPNTHGRYQVYYSQAGRELFPHNLSLADYGMDKLWVIVCIPPPAARCRAPPPPPEPPVANGDANASKAKQTGRPRGASSNAREQARLVQEAAKAKKNPRSTTAGSHSNPADAAARASKPPRQGLAPSSTPALALGAHRLTTATPGDMALEAFPDPCIIAVFDCEHTGMMKGSNIFDVDIYELGAVTLHRTGSSLLRTSDNLSKWVQTTRAWANWGTWSRGNASTAGLALATLRQADSFTAVVAQWFRMLSQLRNSV